MNDFITHTFAQQIHNQQNIWIFILVFAGGIVSSLSPCTLGLLPIVIGYIGGCSNNTIKRNVVQVMAFVVGLSLVLTVLGMTASIAGKALGFQANPVWTVIMASLILLMGLSLMDIIEIPMPRIIKQMPKNTNSSLIFYPLLVGGAFALASTPCSTPILAGIMAYASLKANLVFGGLLLFSFSLGQGVILVLAGLFTSLFKKINHVKSISGYFIKFSGIILILASIYIYIKVFQI